MEASFENSIIYGLAKDLNEGDFTGSQVFFRNVSLKSGGENDDNYIDCMWECDPLFLTDRAKYYFNYHVFPDSPVLGMGNPQFVTGPLVTDIDGTDRLTATAAGNTTLGAYARPEERE